MKSIATSSLALALLAGCYIGGAPGAEGNANGNGNGSGGGNGAGTGSDGGGGSGGASGLPCDVEAVLAKYCTSCHGATPSGGAPVSLLTYADLTKASLSAPSKTEAQLCVDRMKGTPSQMPPSPSTAVAAADLATFEAWVTAGAQTGTCSTSTGPGAATCTSNAHWTGGDLGSPAMHPGVDCLGCHYAGSPSSAGDQDKIMSIAGTVFPSSHDKNDCYGTNGPAVAAKIVITDSKGTFDLPVNSEGNFYQLEMYRLLYPPYSAKLVTSAGERAMVQHQTSGGCNSCHTVNGANGAPGRIVAP